MPQWGFIIGVWLFTVCSGFHEMQAAFSIGCTVGILFQWGWPKLMNRW